MNKSADYRAGYFACSETIPLISKRNSPKCLLRDYLDVSGYLTSYYLDLEIPRFFPMKIIIRACSETLIVGKSDLGSIFRDFLRCSWEITELGVRVRLYSHLKLQVHEFMQINWIILLKQRKSSIFE